MKKSELNSGLEDMYLMALENSSDDSVCNEYLLLPKELGKYTPKEELNFISSSFFKFIYKR